MTRRKVSTAARIAALGELTEMKPRTPMSTMAALVDAAADLVEASHGSEVVGAMFSGLRLTPAQLWAVLARLDLDATRPAEPDAGQGLRLHPSEPDNLEA